MVLFGRDASQDLDIEGLKKRVGDIEAKPAPSLESLGAEAAGTAAELLASHRADSEIDPHPQYILDIELLSHIQAINPHKVTLNQLGGEPQGAEDRARLYTAQEIAALLLRIRNIERRHATRINCGNGPIYYGSDGLWQADSYAPSSGTAVVNINASFPSNPPALGYSDPFVLNFMRFGATFDYVIPVANGLHSVDLLFVEPYFNNPGEKIFNVFLQGVQVLSGFDILANVKKMECIVKTFSNILVSNNKLTVGFTSIRDQASISGIIVRHGL